MEQENMAYRVKEIFYTLQGEGAQAGRPAVFCRFSGCNLWSGRPEDRATAKCRFCDTDFVGADAGVFGVMIRFMPIQLRPPQTARTPWEL